MSLGWKQFHFFTREDKPEVQLPDDIVCSCSSEEDVFFGCADGNVISLDTSLNKQREFQAHATSLLWLYRAHKAPYLLSVGNDLLDDASASLRVWALQHDGEVTLVRSIRLAGSASEGHVAAVAAIEDAWPTVHIAYAVGTKGAIHHIHGDVVRERITRAQLKPPGPSCAWHTLWWAGNATQLYAVAATTTCVVHVGTPPVVSTIDEKGCAKGCCLVDAASALVQGREGAVYYLTPEGRGACVVSDGDKVALAWAAAPTQPTTRLAVVSRARPPPGAFSDVAAPRTLQVFDVRNKLVAASFGLPAEGALHVAAVGHVLLLVVSGRLTVCSESSLAHKVDVLCDKGLFTLALAVATSDPKGDASVVAGIHRAFGDQLYAKHDYDAAVQQYLATIGFLEPSYVIRKFLDAQRITNLTLYLEALHDEGCATADHTTLLLNCYTKLQDIAKLDKFVRASRPDGTPLMAFDVDTAIKVLRGAGYFQHALFIAKASAQPQVCLDILMDDTAQFDEAVQFLQQLPRKQAAQAVQRHGKVLITHRPEPTTALLMQLCTTDGSDDWAAPVSDVAHLFADRPQALLLLCEYILNSSAAPANERALYHMLLYLYLDMGNHDSAYELLRRGWPLGSDAPAYNPQHALVLCNMHRCSQGQAFLYQSMRMFREVLQVYVADGNRPKMLDTCIELGDPATGGDPQLWMQLLEHMGTSDDVTEAEVEAVLQHVEAGNLLPPLLVLQALARNPRLQLGTVRGYVERALAADTAAIEEDRVQVARYREETAAMRAELEELTTTPRVFQNSKCALSGAALELPAVHFLCGHSFNLRAMPDTEGRECPLCAPGFKTLLDIRKSLAAGATQQDRFFTQLHNSADGFSVVADFFGRGLMGAGSR